MLIARIRFLEHTPRSSYRLSRGVSVDFSYFILRDLIYCFQKIHVYGHHSQMDVVVQQPLDSFCNGAVQCLIIKLFNTDT